MIPPSLAHVARIARTLAMAAALGVCAHPPALADAGAAGFYHGKTITLLVGSSPGAGGLAKSLEQIAGGRRQANLDLYARALASFLGEHIVGAPRVIVRDLPGANGLAPIDYLHRQASRDGTAIALLNVGVITNSITGAEPAAADLERLAWLGSIAPDYRLCYLRRDAAPSGWRDLASGKDLAFGATGLTSLSYLEAQILRKVFARKVKPILGYPSRTDVYYAVARGELDGGCSSLEGMPGAWLAGGPARPFVRFLRDRIPEIPSTVPSIFRFAASGDRGALLDLLVAPETIGRPLAVDARTPPDRLNALRQAFSQAMSDPRFLALAQRRNLFVAPKSGQETDEIVRRLMEPPEHLRRLAESLIR